MTIGVDINKDVVRHTLASTVTKKQEMLLRDPPFSAI